jgi:hypothetical protein
MVASAVSQLLSWLRRLTIADIISAVLLIFYIYCFLWGNSPGAHGLAQYWFHPDWATDDSTQQTYPFFRAIRSGAFENDFVSRMMFNYIPPLHYWLGCSNAALSSISAENLQHSLEKQCAWLCPT